MFCEIGVYPDGCCKELMTLVVDLYKSVVLFYFVRLCQNNDLNGVMSL
jgi:hypothetical protein